MMPASTPTANAGKSALARQLGVAPSHSQQKWEAGANVQPRTLTLICLITAGIPRIPPVP